MVDPLEELQHHQRALPASWCGHFQELSQRAGIAVAQEKTGYYLTDFSLALLTLYQSYYVIANLNWTLLSAPSVTLKAFN